MASIAWITSLGLPRYMIAVVDDAAWPGWCPGSIARDQASCRDLTFVLLICSSGL